MPSRHQQVKMSSEESILTPRAAELKVKANDLFKKGDFAQAFDTFSAAISEGGQSHALLFSNRSAAAMKLGNFTQALKDAEKAVKVCCNLGVFMITYLNLNAAQLDPDWEKAHGRVAAAHEYLSELGFR